LANIINGVHDLLKATKAFQKPVSQEEPTKPLRLSQIGKQYMHTVLQSRNQSAKRARTKELIDFKYLFSNRCENDLSMKFLKGKLNETSKTKSAMRGYVCYFNHNIFWHSDSKTNLHVLQFDESGKVNLNRTIILVALTSELFIAKVSSTLKY